MTLRFQFSLRALIAAVAIAALCLGAWQGYKARIAEFVRAESAQVGQPIVLSGRFWLLDGPDSGRFEIGVTRAGSKTVKGATKYYAERGSFGAYQFTEAASYLDQPRWTQPGECDLYVLLPDGRYIAGSVSVRP